MTFSSKIMPNEALDPNSLVGSMLHRTEVPHGADGVETACGSQRLDVILPKPRGIRAFARPLVPFSAIRPDGDLVNSTFCERMVYTYINFDGTAVESMAEVLNIVRDWLVPEDCEPQAISRTTSTAWQRWDWHRWDERRILRETLTAQSQLHAIQS